MIQGIRDLAFSGYCSLILTSALFAAAPQSYQTAAMALPDTIEKAAQNELSGLRQSGWRISVSVDNTAIPDATPRATSAATSGANDEETDSWTKAITTAESTGFDETLSGGLCTALGVTENRQAFAVRQKLFKVDGFTQTLNVSHVRGKTDVIIFYRTANEGWLYLTSPSGVLESGVHAQKGVGVARMTLNSSERADFEREKSWWIQHYADAGAPSTASNP